VDDEGAHED
jgi:hypothetical protein